MSTRTRLWRGAAGLCFDGRYLWVSDAGQFGTDTDAFCSLLRVVDPFSPNLFSPEPLLQATVDLAPYSVQLVRGVRMSADGRYVMACCRMFTGAGTHGVLVIDKDSRRVVGYAQLSTPVGPAGAWWGGGPAPLLYGTPQPSQMARDAVDVGDGTFWVVNANFSYGNAVEKFSWAAVLANGDSPTAPVLVAPAEGHAEDLAYGAGYLWTGSGNQAQHVEQAVVTRIDPATGAGTRMEVALPWGCKFLFGAVWTGGFSGHSGSIKRIDPATFPAPGAVTDDLAIAPGMLGSLSSDGTRLWAATFDPSGGYGGNSILEIDPTAGAVSVVRTVADPGSFWRGAIEGVFDGTSMWFTQRYMHANPGLVRIAPANGEVVVAAWWGPQVPGLVMVDAQAVRENAVRLTFNRAVYFSGILDAADASLPSHYAVAAVDGSTGADGAPARAVTPILAVLPAGGDGTQVDVYLDRPMSPWPAEYAVSSAGLVAADNGDPQDAREVVVPGVYRALVPATSALTSRDLSNPQTPSDAVASGQPAADLGTYSAGADGDLAGDSGRASLRKRIYRRLVTLASRFAHLPGYGVGVPAEVQRLASPANRNRLAAEAERQIALEPEVDRCRVSVALDNATGLARFDVLVRTRAGHLDKFSVAMGK